MMEGQYGFTVLLGLMMLAAVNASCHDDCPKYVTLKDSWRATTHYVGPRGPLNCDQKLRTRWYRFPDGGLLPTTCPASYSCGTRDPIWMKGDMPGPNDGSVNRTVCAVTNNADGRLDCCGQESTIQVRNCGDFIIFRLHGTPICPMAYCVDANPPTPAPINIPTPTPILDGPEISDGNFRFKCKVPNVTQTAYDVRWTFDDEPADEVPPVTLRDGNDVVFLDQGSWVGRVGKELRCSIRARDEANNTVGEFVDSEGYWGGIQVHPPNMTVSEGQGPQTVTLTSTLPIVCAQGDRCELQMALDVEGTRWEDITVAESCLLRISNNNWDAVTRTASVSTRILATRDFVRDGNQNLVVHFRPLYDLAPVVWTDYTPPQLEVQTLDVETRRCYAYADPHIQALEQPEVFHVYDVGDFVLLRSQPNNFEVQVRTWPCVSRSCICGVAIQHQHDAISISLCDGQGQLPPEIRIVGNDALQPGTTITRALDGRNYMIAFGTGEWVKVTDFQSYLNVEVQVTGSEYGVTSGLCGTFDNNTQNDLTSPDGQVFAFSNQPALFIWSWSLPRNESLFRGVLRPVVGDVSRITVQQCMCNAQHDVIDCGITRAIMDPARDDQHCSNCDITDDVNRWRLNGGPGDGDMDDDAGTTATILSDARIATINSTTSTRDIITPHTPTPMSRNSAQDFCRSAMMNQTLALQCTGAVDIQLDSFVNSCVEDILSSEGKLQFLLASVTSWLGACASDVIGDLDKYRVDEDTGRIEPPRVLTSDLCPGQCSLRGQCVDGVCACDAGWAGVDCSVTVDNPPVILRIARNGLCDANRRPCREAFLTVDNFMSTSEISCRIRDVQMTRQGPVTSEVWRPVTADFYTNRQVACRMPDSRVPGDSAIRAYFISVTTDGQHFSNEALYIVYDVTCVDCDVFGNCTVRTDACFIGNLCYRIHELNPANPDLWCDPRRSNFDWSRTLNQPADELADKVDTRQGYVCPLETLTFTRWDIWTSNETGCPCHFNQSSGAVCACCEAGACQCTFPNHHQCVLCGRQDLDCGTRQPSPQFGVDGWTANATGCACPFDPSRDDCACCQNHGCQCPRHFRNQCAPCGRPEVCGSKPDVFGIPLP